MIPLSVLFDITSFDFRNDFFAFFHTDSFLNVLLIGPDKERPVTLKLRMVAVAFSDPGFGKPILLPQRFHISLMERNGLLECVHTFFVISHFEAVSFFNIQSGTCGGGT